MRPVLTNTVRDTKEIWTRENWLTSKAVERPSLSFQGVDHVHGSDRLPVRVLSVGDRVTDHIFQEEFEDSSGLIVDLARDSLDSAAACEASDGRLGDALDVVAEQLSVTLRAFNGFAALAAFSTS